MPLKTASYVIATMVLLAIAGCFGLMVHQAVPYFAVIPPERFKTWHPAPYVPAGSGSTWKLSQYLEDAGAMNADVDHFVLQRDGKAYDLINSRDSWGFGNAPSWEIDLIGDQLYVYDAHQHVSSGWFHLTIGQRGWLIDRLGFGPEGNFHTISPRLDFTIPSTVIRGGLYQLEIRQLRYVGTFTDSDDILEHVENGDYYLAPPGTGVRKIFNMNETPATH